MWKGNYSFPVLAIAKHKASVAVIAVCCGE